MTSQIKRKRRTNAEVEAVREAAREELAAHHPMTLRQVHYRLVSRDDIVHPNTQAAYNTLSGWLRDDRLNAVIPWAWMEDRMRRARGWEGCAVGYLLGRARTLPRNLERRARLRRLYVH